MCVCVFPVKLLSSFISQSCTTLWGLRGAPGIAPVSWWWHQSRRRGGCFGGLVVASLEEALGVSHFLIACIQATTLKGFPGGALVGCYEPTCQMLLFAFTLSLPSSDTQTYSHKHVQYRYPVHCTLLGTLMSCAGGKFEGIEGGAVTDCYCICTCTVVPLSTDDASALIPVAKRSRGVTSEGSLSQAFGLQCQPCILTTVINHLHSQQLA